MNASHKLRALNDARRSGFPLVAPAVERRSKELQVCKPKALCGSSVSRYWLIAALLSQTLQLWKHVLDGVKLPKAASKAELGEKSAGKGVLSRAAPPLPPRPSDAGDADAAAPDTALDGKKAVPEGLREEDCEYRLYACIMHKGQSQSRGHYYAICRAGRSDEDW